MTRLIDADALYRQVKAECNPYGKPTIDFESGKKVLDLIDNAPIEPQIIVFAENADEQAVADLKAELQSVLEARPQGCWNYIQPGTAVCSFCGASPHKDYKNFCPNCGADMRKGEKTNEL